jgi:hypothetical protein
MEMHPLFFGYAMGIHWPFDLLPRPPRLVGTTKDSLCISPAVADGEPYRCGHAARTVRRQHEIAHNERDAQFPNLNRRAGIAKELQTIRTQGVQALAFWYIFL